MSSARLRARYARSSASSSSHGASTSCAMRGIEATAVDPSADTSTGTSRQPNGSSPSARQASSTTPRSHGSRRKHIAIPAPSIPVSVRWSGRSTPAPSPVTPSAAQAPRCATAASPASARSTSSRDERPRASATRPMPQASRSRCLSSRSVEGLRISRLSGSRDVRRNEPPAVCLSASPAEAGEVAG